MFDDDSVTKVPEADQLEHELEEGLPAAKSPSDWQSILELTRGLARLPFDQATVALETSASIAAVSLRASIEFLRAAPEAAAILDAASLRCWGEMGRRLAISDVETAISFFAAGVVDLQEVAPDVRPLVLQGC